MSIYLSKSDFKVARSCATKLYYKKLGYPSARDDDEYLQFLADGGYMVEAIAKLCHPDGIEIGFDHGPEASAQETMRALEAHDSVTIFEATLISKQRLARVDILEKRGNRFRLIEVKAKSFNSIEEGRCSLLDVLESDLRGATGRRQKIQLEWTRKNSEFVDARLPAILTKCAYPLHFIDFETSRLAVPYHAGMRPYEQVAFQWSCHTIGEPDGELTHTEWINIEDAYPNFEFARSLKDILGQSGTIFIWSLFERTALRDIRWQLIKYREKDRELADWLDAVVAVGGPLVDLCQLAKEHYFHPRMKGKLSLKCVLPAVWESDHALHTHPVFAKYYRRGVDGAILNPYDTLHALPFGNPEEDEETDQVVREGTGAMRAYQEMLYGLRRNDDATKDQWRRLLLQYCELDTAAMAIVWTHWSMNAPPDETR